MARRREAGFLGERSRKEAPIGVSIRDTVSERNTLHGASEPIHPVISATPAGSTISLPSAGIASGDPRALMRSATALAEGSRATIRAVIPG